jgi:ribosome-binding ATPase YchF (GTP1/OBG family)
MESFQLITTKPVLYVCNVDENSAVSVNRFVELVKDEDAEVIILSVGAEAILKLRKNVKFSRRYGNWAMLQYLSVQLIT